MYAYGTYYNVHSVTTLFKISPLFGSQDPNSCIFIELQIQVCLLLISWSLKSCRVLSWNPPIIKRFGVNPLKDHGAMLHF